MLTTAKVLCQLVRRYTTIFLENDRDCRLLIPGLTAKLARQVHELLVENDINSFLVIGEDSSPSEEAKLITAQGLTSKRIGSFVGVVTPGQLVHIQDSIRGSGGTIRSMAFSEEWPWIDDRDEAFRFDGPFVDLLIDQWCDDPATKSWFRQLILEGLVKHTKSSPKRSGLLLEVLLGSFDPTANPEIEDVREKFLCHIGIPRRSPVPGVDRLIGSATQLSSKILHRCEKEDDLRQQVLDRADDVCGDAVERTAIKEALNEFLDCVGRSEHLNLELLSFHGCWGQLNKHWPVLTADRLAQVFSIEEREKAGLECELRCSRGIVDSTRRKVATFHGEEILVHASFTIPLERFSSTGWCLRVSYRTNTVEERWLTSREGDVDITLDSARSFNRYKRKIPLRVSLIFNDQVEVEKRLEVNLCGDDRPSFLVVEPGFQTIDTVVPGNEEIPDKKVDIDEPVEIHLLTNGTDEVSLLDEQESEVEVVETDMAGIWRATTRVDVDEATGQRLVKCVVGGREAVICLESSEAPNGDFTLEDELRTMICGIREKRLDDVLEIFRGTSRTPFLGLGQLDDTARKRITLAGVFTTPSGWKPLLVDFANTSTSHREIGDFVNSLSDVQPETFRSLSLPTNARSLLNAYQEARQAILKQVDGFLDTLGTRIDHPLYASHPVFVHSAAAEMERLISAYLDAYKSILDYVREEREKLEWAQLLVLSYLDCVVHWSSGARGNFFLLGPWHPMSLAKRFMIQAALVDRAIRLIQSSNGKLYRELTAQLGAVQGFRWFPALSANDKVHKPAMLLPSSDPGWHIAFSEPGQTAEIRMQLWQSLGLSIKGQTGVTEDLSVTALSNYMRAFPSRRSVGIGFRHGQGSTESITSASRLIHGDDGPTESGLMLPGGVRLYFSQPLEGQLSPVRWSNPSLCVYRVETVAQAEPDIYMLPPVEVEVTPVPNRDYSIPRGLGHQSIFSHGISWLTEGQTLVPRSIEYDLDTTAAFDVGIAGSFKNVLGSIGSQFTGSFATVSSIDLPERLSSPWIVVPGRSIDPAVLVKYVRDGVDRSIEERSLWDYKVSVSGDASSFFILSKIPKSFAVAVNGFFGKAVSGEMIAELGNVGIAIGGEALKSGRHALGITGLVGAVRLLRGQTQDGKSPLRHSHTEVGFLLPIDSFESFFGKSDESSKSRTDILAVQLTVDQSTAPRLLISACGVESKFVSGTFSSARAREALRQAHATLNEFKTLIRTSLLQGGIPERLALLSLIRFGVRVSAVYAASQESWAKLQSAIYNAILCGRYEYSEAKHPAVVVSTEASLPGTAESTTFSDGNWVRITKTHWPGVSESAQLEAIRQDLCELFEHPGDDLQIGRPSEPTDPTPDGSSPPDSAGSDSKHEAENETQSNVDSTPDAAVVQDKSDVEDVKTTALTFDTTGSDAGGRLFSFLIGVDEARRTVQYDPQSISDPLDNINVMVTGSSGTGKTQFLKYLICKLREQEKNVLVIDLKNDFASDDHFCRTANVQPVFTTFDGLPFNPLIPYPVSHPRTGEKFVQCAQYISGVSSVLRRTYGLGPQQQASVKNAIVEAFETQGIATSGSTRYDATLRFPDFSNVGDTLQESNVSAYNRLDPLFTLGLFRREHRAHSFHDLVQGASILDLSQIPSDEIKNAIAQLIVLSAHSYYNTQQHSGVIRQFLIFDEGHRVLNSEFMLRLVRECRAYGVGTVLSSQYPSDFPAEISASMATKVIHGNGRDSDKVKDIVQLIGATGRESDVASLVRFQAFVDNRHYPHTLTRTMSYPLHLVWKQLLEKGELRRQEFNHIDGLDVTKLPIEYLISELQRLGIAEERDGVVRLVRS